MIPTGGQVIFLLEKLYLPSVTSFAQARPGWLAVNLVRSNGAQAPTGLYLVDMPPQYDFLSVGEHFVAFER